MKEIHVDLGEGREEIKTILLPDTIVEPDVQEIHIDPSVKIWTRPKVCPSCGAKFAHSQAEGRCQKCKLPDEVIAMGLQAIVRWKRLQGTPKHKPRPSTHNKKRRGHGR